MVIPLGALRGSAVAAEIDFVLRRTKSAELYVAAPAAAPPPWGYEELQFAQALEVVRHQAMVLDVHRRLAAAAHGERGPSALQEPPDTLGLRAKELAERERELDELQAKHARVQAWAETAIGKRMADLAETRARIGPCTSVMLSGPGRCR